MCVLISEYLQTRGHACDWLDDPFQLVGFLRLNPCDAVILDLEMPGVAGLELLVQIRAAFPDLPVLIFTGAGYDDGKMQAALCRGAHAFVSKGLSVGDIYVALTRVMLRARARAANLIAAQAS